MIFKKNKPAKKEILLKENICISKDNYDVSSAIHKVGEMLENGGYIQHEYIEAMKKRNTSLSVFLGNYLAVPHGEFEAKKHILHSGISVLALPNGMDWDGNKVHFVIGLAGQGEEHMEILSNIAQLFQEEKDVLNLMSATVDQIYKAFTSSQS